VVVELTRYAVPGWGVGELGMSGTWVAEHVLPRPGTGEVDADDDPLVARIKAYFAGERDDFADVELFPYQWSRFHRDVLAALREVPYGEVVTYGELAALAGYPGAQRAAGTFCAGNHFGLFVPCHRVVGASGIGSYGSLGVEYKRRLLELEGVTL
jgi:methylated-DNA-[protein]-cysteine S-methyltransferase